MCAVALEDANKNSWGNTFSKQAAKVVNSQLEKTITPLMSEVERLKDLVLTQEQEIVQLQALNSKQLEELTVDAEVKEQTTIAEFGELGERFGWAGWSHRGYRAANGILHTGIGAIKAFISDLAAEQPNYEQGEIAF